MEIFSAIVQLLGGLAMFLYGIEVMGDGLKNSSGEALKRILEKVTGSVVTGVMSFAEIYCYHRSDRCVDRRWCSESEAGGFHRDGCQYRYHRYRSDHSSFLYRGGQ